MTQKHSFEDRVPTQNIKAKILGAPPDVDTKKHLRGCLRKSQEFPLLLSSALSQLSQQKKKRFLSSFVHKRK